MSLRRACAGIGLCWLLAAGSVGCGRSHPEPPPQPSASPAEPAASPVEAEAPPSGAPPCPAGFAFIEVADGGESLVLGARHDDLVQGFGSDVLRADPERPLRLPGSFCFSETMLPGRGKPLLLGEQAVFDVARIRPSLVPALARFGRRLPTFEEYLLVAQGRGGWAYPYRPEAVGPPPPCEPDPRNAPTGTIGGWPDCVTRHSSWRVYDLGTRATPVTLSADLCRRVEASALESGYSDGGPAPEVLAACDALGAGTDPEQVRVLFVGSFDHESLGLVPGREAAFWSPSPAGRHFHDGAHAAFGGAFVDDGGVFVVAEPGPADPRTEAAWAACMELLSEEQRWSVVWGECLALR